MAEALIRGLLAQRVFANSDLIASDIDRGRRQRLKRTFKIDVTDSNAEVLHGARAILIAVKPQNIGEVLVQVTEVSGAERPNGRAARANRHDLRARKESSIAVQQRLFISIAAGITIARLTDALGMRARIIRVMPNAPAMVGEGMAAIVRGAAATRADEAFALKIFNAVGDAVTLKDERMLDAVTALSGS